MTPYLELKNQLKKEVYSSGKAPNKYVVARIQQLYEDIADASRNGLREERDMLARQAAVFQVIGIEIDQKPWVNL